MQKNTKKRNWTIVLYPESAPDNWRELIKETGLSFAVSPLHDKDISGDDLPKKPHYHIIMCYPGPTTYNVVKSFFDTLNCPIPKPLESVQGMYRYFTHMDDPHKYQYDEKEIEIYNGFDIREYIALSKNEVDKLKMKIQLLIREYKITEYAELMDLLLDNDMTDEWTVASSNTVFFDRYISSKRYGKEENKNG